MRQSARILVIEDDPDFAEVMKAILEPHGHVVEVVDRPAAGMESALRNKPDLIVLDVMFGREGKTEGFDFAVKARQDKSLAAIPILMVTAVNVHHPGYRYSAETDGEYLPVDGFLDKPAIPLDVIEKVTELLAKKTSRWKNWPEIEDDGSP
jgi:CheY-like chemotaxis protein